MKMLPSKTITYIFITIGVIGILDSLILLTLGNAFDFGIYFPLTVSIILLISGFYRYKKKKYVIKDFKERKVFSFIMILFLALFLIVEGMIFYSAKADSFENVDYIIILGSGLKGDRLTITLENRLKKGLDILKNNPDLKAIVTGGMGNGETITEAEAMKRYLVNNGITNDRVIMEDKATSTMENFRYSKELMYIKEKTKVLVVTSDFHMYRSKFLAQRNGFVAFGAPAKTWTGVFINCSIREFFAVIKSLLFDK